MLSHESEVLHYNSHLVLEAAEFVDPEALSARIIQLCQGIPLLRTRLKQGVWGPKRYVASPKQHREFLDSNKLLKVTGPLSQGEHDDFCNQAFDLYRDAPLRFLLEIWPDRSQSRITFSVHHSICDGAAQELSEWATRSQSLRWRHLLVGAMGWRWVIAQFRKYARPLGNLRRYEMASLIENFDIKARRVTARHLPLSADQSFRLEELSRTHGASLIEILCWSSLKALEETRTQLGHAPNPLMIWCPMSLRPFFKIRRSFQNLLSTVWIVAKPNEARNTEFLEKIKCLVQSHDLDRAAKFLFGNLWLYSLLPFKILKRWIRILIPLRRHSW